MAFLSEVRAGQGCRISADWTNEPPLRGWRRPRTTTRGAAMKNIPFDPATVARVASDTLTIRRVFGEPYTANGVTIIPVAKVWGGAGGGGGQDERPARDGTDSVESAGAPDGAVETDPDEAADVPDDVASHRAFGGGSGFGVRVHALGVYVVDVRSLARSPRSALRGRCCDAAEGRARFSEGSRPRWPRAGHLRRRTSPGGTGWR